MDIFVFPSSLFVHGIHLGLDTATFSVLINSLIFLVMTFLTTLILGYYKNIGTDVIGKYSVLFLSVLIVMLVAEFFGHFRGYGYLPTFEELLFGAIICSFIRNATEVMCLVLIVKSLSLMKIFENKHLYLLIITASLYTLLMVLNHLNSPFLEMLMYISKGIGIGSLTSYFVSKENSLITPAVFFGLIGLTSIPRYFAIDSSLRTSTLVIIVIVYLCIASALIATIVYEMKHKTEEKDFVK